LILADHSHTKTFHKYDKNTVFPAC